MAVDIVAEVLAQRGALVSAEEARALMERWTAQEYAVTVNSLQVLHTVGCELIRRIYCDAATKQPVHYLDPYARNHC